MKFLFIYFRFLENISGKIDVYKHEIIDFVLFFFRRQTLNNETNVMIITLTHKRLHHIFVSLWCFLIIICQLLEMITSLTICSWILTHAHITINGYFQAGSFLRFYPLTKSLLFNILTLYFWLHSQNISTRVTINAFF